MGTANWLPYLLLLMMVVVARFIKDRLSQGSEGEQSGTHVSAEIHSPAEPIVVYKNPLDEYLAKNYPNARR